MRARIGTPPARPGIFVARPAFSSRGGASIRASGSSGHLPRRRQVAVLLVAAVLTVAATSSAQNFGGSHDRFFTVEWRAVLDSGRPVLVGSVRNEWNTTARGILLRVTELDAAGQPADTILASVSGEATPTGRVFFKVPVRSTTAAYRVEVESFAWIHRGR